jgi:Arc/MetJ family transcription regulator
LLAASGLAWGVSPVVMLSHTHKSRDPYTSGCTLRTNIEIDDELMKQAMATTGAKTKKDTVDAALRLMVRLKQQGEAIESLWGIATWAGPDDDWSAPDPLMVKGAESRQEDDTSEDRAAAVEATVEREAVKRGGH